MTDLRGLDTIIVYTHDIERLSAFYADGLGLTDPNRVPGHVGFDLPDGVYLGFDDTSEMPVGAGGVTLWFDVADLDATFGRFVDMGAAVRYPPELKPMGDVLASLIDPDGNVFGLVSR